jgi:ankyrin repeat protein
LNLMLSVPVAGVCLMSGAFAQALAKIDFGRDILPVFRQNCFACHGPTLQINGLRMDRRSSVFKEGMRRVVPGSTDNSFLYHRVTGTEFGLQMPPAGPLKADQIRLIKAWIEQGAPWPDSLANEAELPPANPKAVSLVESLRTGDRQSFLKAVAQDPKLLNARGPEGSTPFMYAVLYGDAPFIEQLLKKGADPNARNDARATSLMWAATNLEKTRVLLAHGAEVNTVSADMRSPLMIAAGAPAGRPIVRLLLERGANPNPTANPPGESSPLIQAAMAADAERMQMLIDKGADVKKAGATALAVAVNTNCSACVDLLAQHNLDKDAYTMSLGMVVNFGSLQTVKLMLDHGAEINAVDPSGRTALMYAAVSDLVPVEIVKMLIERGADVNARSQHKNSGDSDMSVLDIARMQGETPVVDLLLKAGAKSARPPHAAPAVARAASARTAVERALALVQRTDQAFSDKSGCISCHNNSIGAMAVGLARKQGFPVDERISARQVKVNVAYLEHNRDALHQGFFAAQSGSEAFGDIFGPGVLAYVLVGLDAEHYKPDLNTDAVAMYLKSRQMPDGQWTYPAADFRQPLCSDHIGQTVRAMRSLQLYAPQTEKAEYEKAVRLAADWIARAEPRGNEDLVWKLLGLSWAARDKAAIQKTLKEVLSIQKQDGGWSDLPASPTTAYATGKALVALHTAGVPVSDTAFQRGVQFLLNTQIADGSWFVRTRALGFQPYFDSSSPHGMDQSISSAGTGWAAMALALAAPAETGKTVAQAK